MTLRNTFPSGLPTGLPILDTRLALSGLIARDVAGQPRLGLLPDTLDPVVTGTSSMAYQVGPFRAVTSRGGLGVELVANDGAVKVDTTAAPSTNARLDVIYVQPRFSLDGDSTDSPAIGVVQGATAPIASLVRPAAPAGALILAVAQVSFGATSTAGSAVVITQVAPFTAASGGTVVVRNTSELNGWAPHNGNRVFNLFDRGEYSRVAGSWRAESRDAIVSATNASYFNTSNLRLARRGNTVTCHGEFLLAQSVSLTAGVLVLVGTVPLGFRPNTYVRFNVASNGVPLNGLVSETGEIQVRSPFSAATLFGMGYSLGGATWVTDEA